MTTLAADARRDLPLALIAAGTTWFTMLSWRGFTDLWGAYLGPLLLVAAVVGFGGALLRSAPVSRRAGFGLHVLLIAFVVWLMLGGSLIHPVSSTHDIARSVNDAWFSASTFAPPIPDTVPSIAPLMIPCGALALLVVDLLACWVRRVPLAGLPLLAVYCVPISLLGDGVSWVIFLGGAAGFLLMLFFQESAHIARWGRPLGATAAAADPSGFGMSTGASKTSASTVGTVAVVLAVILPLFIPTLHLDGLGLFGPGGGGSAVKVVNPITDMRRNLDRGKNVPLLEVHTTDPDPSYMRIAVLTEFNGVEWTTGDRAIVPDQTANGLLPVPEQYLGAGVVTHPYQYSVTATKYFDSTWLPTEFPVSSIVAPGDWHYDLTTMDFLASNAATNTQGITYRMTAAKPVLSAYSMVNSLTAPQQIQSVYTALPSQVSPLASELARKVTRGATSRFQEMEMLQQWFRSTGGFRYSLKTAPGDGNSALDHFLQRGDGGRVGYCEQFASAFAVMARTLDVPARVAVGFLQPTQVSKDEWLYRAHDLHAWPEVFFRGSGWVRFEPTPASRTHAAPSYTVGPIKKPGHSSAAQSAGGKVTDPASASPSVGPHNKTSSSTTSSSPSTDIPWTGILLTLLVLGLVGVLLMVPGAVRRSRRTRRLAGGAEDAWAELRDTAVDLGVSWPGGRSPRETGERLAGWFGPEPDGAPAARPPRGRGLAPGAEAALDRIVLMVEQVRYARSANDVPGALAEDVSACIAALEHGSTSRTLRGARWLPRSVFSGSRQSRWIDPAREPEAVSPGGVVDHVG